MHILTNNIFIIAFWIMFNAFIGILDYLYLYFERWTPGKVIPLFGQESTCLSEQRAHTDPPPTKASRPLKLPHVKLAVIPTNFPSWSLRYSILLYLSLNIILDFPGNILWNKYWKKQDIYLIKFVFLYLIGFLKQVIN